MPNIVQSASATSTTSTTIVTMPGDVTAGNLLIVMVGHPGGNDCGGGVSPAVFSDTRSLTFTPIKNVQNVSGGQSQCCISKAPITSSGPEIITRTGITFPVAMFVAEIEGYADATIDDSDGGTADFGTTVSTGNATSVNTDCLLVGMGSDSTATANSFDSLSPSGGTESFDGVHGAFVVKAVAAGTYSCTFNKSAGGGRYSAATVLFSNVSARSASDSLSLLDSISTLREQNFSFADTLSLSDSVSVAVTGAAPTGILVTSFISLTDTATASFGVAIPPHRGNIDYDQIRVSARAGDGAKFHTLTGSLTTGNTVIVDSGGNLVDAGAAPGVGTVSSVAQSVPTSLLAIAGSPIITSGTLALSLIDQDANKVFAGPTTGADAAPTFRAIVEADLPLGSSSAFGAVKVDNTTITAAAGVISAVAPTANVLFPGVPASGTIPDLSGYTVVNSAVLTSQTGGAGYPALIKITGNASVNWRSLKTSLPSAPYKIIVRLNSNRAWANSTALGIYFFDNSNKMAGIETLYQSTAGTPLLRIHKGTSPTTDTSDTPTAYGFVDGNGYLAIAQDTSSVNQIYSYSPDGVNWLVLLSEATGTFVTPTGWGIGGACVIASVDIYASLTYYRLTT